MSNKVICPDCDRSIDMHGDMHPWVHNIHCAFYGVRVLETEEWSETEELHQSRQRIDELEEQNRDLLKQIDAMRHIAEDVALRYGGKQ